MAVATITNPLHVAQDCVFCLDGGGTIKNTGCDCKYYFHPNCRVMWAESNRRENKPVLCVMCRAPEPVYITIVLEEQVVNHFINCRRTVLSFVILVLILATIFIGYRLFF